MKNSSKILLGAFLVIIVGLIILLSVIRSNLYENYETIEGNRVIKEEIRIVEDFTVIDAKQNINIILKQDTFQQVKIIADENIIGIIKTSVDNGKLKVSADNKIKKASKKDVYITYDTLTQVKVSQGAIVKAENTIKGKRLKLSLKEGGIGDLNIDLEELNTSIVAGGVLTISGNANYAKINATAGAVINGKELNGDEMNIEAVAGSVIKVGTAKTLNIKANSGSVIKYNQNSGLGDIDISSGARIKKY